MRSADVRRGLPITRLAWLAIAALALSCRLTPPAADFSIDGVTVIDAIGGVRGDQRVVVAGDRIVWVDDTQRGGPPARRQIDGAGLFVIPGLWDAHVHFLYEAELSDAMPALFLQYGITSVRDTGGDLDRLVALRESWARDGIPAPRTFVAGPLLDGEHVVYDGLNAEQPKLGVANPDVEAARERVRSLHARGADFIKIYELVSPSVFDALVAAARELELPIASHVPLSLLADEAGPRVDSMEHLRNIELACARNWQALLELRRGTLRDFGGTRGHDLRRSIHDAQRYAAIEAHDPARCDAVLESLRGTLQVPTLRLNAFNHSRPFRDSAWRDGAQLLPPALRARWEASVREFEDPAHEWDLRLSEWSLDLVGRMNRKGIPIGAGTDTPIRLAIPGESLHRELELLVEGGLTPRQALNAATVAPAKFFRLEQEMGQVEVGMRADLVLLEANPLEDIRNTRRIRGVVARGSWVGEPRN